jgi:hypothetical protein
MQLNPAAFDSFLAGNIGQFMNWRKGNACPCFNPDSGAALPGHPLCGGKGWIWDAPIKTRAGLTQQKVERQWAQFGQFEPGDGILTIPQAAGVMYDFCGRFDRIELLNSTDAFKLLLIRGAPNERIFLPVVNFTRVFYLDPNNINATIEAGLPVVDVNGVLTWPNNDGPPLNTQYSIAGIRNTDYYVFDKLPSDRNEHFGKRLPRKLFVRRFDLFSR